MSEIEPVQPSPELPPAGAVSAAVAADPPASAPAADCPTCGASLGGGAPPAFVYAIGRIEPRFPMLSVEKEFAQRIGGTDTANLTERRVLHRVLSQRENRYLARQLCWVMTIEGLETYIVMPRDPADLDLLIEAVRAAPRSTDIDLVIGQLGPIAPPSLCNGLTIPIVVFDQLYSFDVDALIGTITCPDNVPSDRFKEVAEEVYNRVVHMSDNAGATDEHRALNYLTVRYPGLYAAVAEAQGRSASLSAVEVRPSLLSGTRRIVDVVFSFTDRATEIVDKRFVRVDVSEKFPFLVTRLSPYYDVH